MTQNHLTFALCPSQDRACSGVAHLHCLSNHFHQSSAASNQSGPRKRLLPDRGTCPECDSTIRWEQVIRGCYRRRAAQENGGVKKKRLVSRKALAVLAEDDEQDPDEIQSPAKREATKKRASKAVGSEIEAEDDPLIDALTTISETSSRVKRVRPKNRNAQRSKAKVEPLASLPSRAKMMSLPNGQTLAAMILRGMFRIRDRSTLATSGNPRHIPRQIQLSETWLGECILSSLTRGQLPAQGIRVHEMSGRVHQSESGAQSISTIRQSPPIARLTLVSCGSLRTNHLSLPLSSLAHRLNILDVNRIYPSTISPPASPIKRKRRQPVPIATSRVIELSSD